MMVLIFSKVRVGFRGRISRHLIQPQTNVFVGHLSGRRRERVWEQVEEEVAGHGGSAILIHPAPTEQGFSIRTCGETPSTMRDFDGLTLPKTPLKP